MQRLVFLIRDWEHSLQYRYGVEGGQGVLDDMFQVSANASSSQLKMSNTSTYILLRPSSIKKCTCKTNVS